MQQADRDVNFSTETKTQGDKKKSMLFDGTAAKHTSSTTQDTFQIWKKLLSLFVALLLGLHQASLGDL